jgi:hypothetical protein
LYKVWLLSKGSFPTFRGHRFEKKVPHRNISLGPHDVYEMFMEVWLKRDWFLGEMKRYRDRQRETQRQTDRQTGIVCHFAVASRTPYIGLH